MQKKLHMKRYKNKSDFVAWDQAPHWVGGGGVAEGKTSLGLWFSLPESSRDFLLWLIHVSPFVAHTAQRVAVFSNY